MRLTFLLLLPAVLGAQDAGTDAEPQLGEVTATIDVVLRKMAREANQAGIDATQRKDFPTALAAFRRAHDAVPDDAEIANNFAYLHFLLGNHAEARRLYRLTLRLDGGRRVAHINLTELLMREGAGPEELREARGVLRRARDRLGNDAEVVLWQARLAARQGRTREAERLYSEWGELDTGGDPLFLEIGDFYRDTGRPEVALEWYRRVKGTAGPLQAAAQRIRDIEIERRARSYGWKRPTRAVPEQAQTLREAARAALRQGQLEDAARMLDEAVAMAPLFAGAHADLGDVYQARDDGLRAELSYLRALTLDAGDADISSRLAALYTGQQRPAEAVRCLQRALQARPDWTHLQLRLAKAYRAAGDIPQARAWVERYLAEQPEDSPDEAAESLRRALAAHAGAQTTPTAPAQPERRDERVARARALFDRNEPDAALSELDAMPADQIDEFVLNLRGTFMYQAGRMDEAAEAFTASLVYDAGQPEVLELLAAVRLRQARAAEARALLERAERAGGHEAKLGLARLDAAGHGDGWLADLRRGRRLRAARDSLRAYLAGEPRRRGEAATLLGRVEARLQTLLAWGVGLVGGLLVVLGVSAVRLWGGQDLGAFVRRHPEAGPEVQRVLAGVRHEVLKHNTMVLTGLVDALVAGDEVGEKAAWCRRSLLGAEGGEEESAVARLRGYADRLIQVGRAHGVRLNLRRKDPALGALLRGFRVLSRSSALLERADSLGPRGRRRLLRALEQATRLLNVEGYEAVRALLDQLRMLDVDEALLRTVYGRVVHEPAFAAGDFAELELELEVPLPCRVAVPRHAFEDVLGNLVRNAVQSSVRHGEGAVHIGLGLHQEVDAITGLERVVFLIRDRSPQQLTPEMLRGRYIEAGLGLTADLVSRYEGTLDVRAGEAPWTKAVVVKLPRFDEGEDDPWQS